MSLSLSSVLSLSLGSRKTVAAAGAAFTVDQVVTKSGNTYTFTGRRTGDISGAASAPYTIAPSSLYVPPAFAGDLTGLSGTLNFLAGAATATFAVNTANSFVVPE